MIGGIPNVLTIDVEDYFQVSAFESISPPETWGSRESRVESNTLRILDILSEAAVKATFFVLGWVADRFPGLVRRISDAGHEVAAHGYGHRRVYQQTRSDFRQDVRRGKTLLEDLAGRDVLGYRAPSYSISQSCLWAFDELFEAGFSYDSSVFPIRHDLYGMPFWPRFPFVIERLEGEGQGNWVPVETRGSRGSGGVSPSLIEVPITTLRLFGSNWPIAGGGYFRLFPFALTLWGLRRINSAEGKPFVFYIHPWELDPLQPRMGGAGFRSRFRHYVNLGRTEGRFRRLLASFSFGPLRDVLGISPCGSGRGSVLPHPLP